MSDARPKWDTSADTSARMQKQPSKDTQPELALRRLLNSRGLRYRLQWPVPGMPRRSIDIAFPSRKLAVFVDGCFWHGCPTHGVQPRHNAERWSAKIAGNMARDRQTTDHLADLGWTVVRCWEHEDAAEAADRLERLILSQSGERVT